VSYGNMGFGAGHDRRMANPTYGRTADPMVKELMRRARGFTQDTAHVNPAGELVMYEMDPFGGQIRQLKKDLDDGGKGAAQVMDHNRGMTAIFLEDQRRRQGLPG
jgi:hypothetical protein